MNNYRIRYRNGVANEIVVAARDEEEARRIGVAEGRLACSAALDDKAEDMILSVEETDSPTNARGMVQKEGYEGPCVPYAEDAIVLGK